MAKQKINDKKIQKKRIEKNIKETRIYWKGPLSSIDGPNIEEVLK